MKWEYKVTELFRPRGSGSMVEARDVESALNRLSEDGWELVGSHPSLHPPTNDGIFLIFKRPVEE